MVPTEPADELAEGFVESLAKEMRDAKSYKGTKNTPPVEVFRNKRGELEVVDGHHRLEAAKRAGVDADIVPALPSKLEQWLRLKGRADEIP